MQNDQLRRDPMPLPGIALMGTIATPIIFFVVTEHAPPCGLRFYTS